MSRALAPSVCPIVEGRARTAPSGAVSEKKFLISGRTGAGTGRTNTSCFSAADEIS